MPPGKKRVIEIREIHNDAGFRACWKLQREIWGPQFTDLVPASILMVAAKTGGLVLGAFDGPKMVGFVCGFAGWKDSQKIHWSDMLAVKKPYRNQDIGLKLKLRQRQILKRRGVEEIYWTFDPLESKNAYFNFAKLGVVSREYAPNLYGQTHSPLHQGRETDRLLAVWKITDSHSKGGRTPSSGVCLQERNLINHCLLSKEAYLLPKAPNLDLKGEPLFLEIPSNLLELGLNPRRSRSYSIAIRQWLCHVRTACLCYFKKGYQIRHFIQASVNERKGSFYVFEKK